MEKEENSLITPVTTPTTNQNCRGVADNNQTKPWYQIYPPPFVILAISCVQLVVFLINSKNIITLFRFNPNRQLQIWRFITYMFVHDDLWHLSINLTVQCFFAFLLEQEQGGWRVGVIYLIGGGLGALGAACVRSDVVVGASAGGYALLTSHISNILICYKQMKYKMSRLVSVLLMIVSDVTYSAMHVRSKGEPAISEGAHVVGALSGLFLSLMLFRGNERAFIKFFMCGLTSMVILIYVLLIIDVQVRKCTPKNWLHSQYVYLC